MKGHVRSVKIGLEGKLKCEIPETPPLMTWISAFAGSSYRRYHIGRDGKTPLERILGRTIAAPVAHFGESIWWKPLSPSQRPGALEDRFQEGYFIGYVEGTSNILC